MKKIFYILASAIVALGAVACENDVMDNIATVEGDTVSFVAAIDDTKTDLTADNKTIWDEDDTIVIEWDQNGNSTIEDAEKFSFTNTAEDVNTFSCTADGLRAITEANVVATYSNKNDGNIDSEAGKAGSLLTYSGAFTDLSFTVQNAFLKFTAAEGDEVTLTASAEIFSTGTELTLTATGEAQYVAILPATTTITYAINDVVCTTSKENALAVGKIYNLGALNAPTFADGKYFVVAKKDEGGYWGMKYDETANYRTAISTTVTEYTDYTSFNFTSDYVWTITSVDGGYTISHNGNYLTAVSGQNQAKITNAAEDAEKVTISKDGDFYTILTTSSLDETRILRFNTNAGQERFAFYKTSVAANVSNIVLIPVPADAQFKETMTMSFANVTITEGETFTAPEPTFTPTPEGNYTITYEVTEGTIASIVDNKVVCDGNTVGTATIKATFTGDNYYDTTATYTITVNEEQQSGAPVYKKVTEAPADWSGKYLIVWGTEAHATVSGSDLAKTADVTISNNEIASSSTVDAAAVTVATTASGYSVLLPSGKYLSLHYNGNRVAETASAFDIYFEYTTNGVKILGKDNSSNERVVTNNGIYYRAYKTSVNSTSSYTLPTLYKYTEAVDVTPDPTPDPEPTPEIEISVENQEIANTEGEDTILVTVTNGEGYIFEATTTADWIDVEWNNGVYYFAEANTTNAERTATVEIHATDGDNVVTKTFTITQAAGASTGDDVEIQPVSLTNANIANAYDSASTSYRAISLTDASGNNWSAYAICNQHSKATSTYKFLQIKASSTYYIQMPTFDAAIKKITMTVSSSSKPMTDGGNTATLYFSSDTNSSNAIASATGTSSVTIDCSTNTAKTGYILASGAVRIWDITVEF